MKPLPTDIEQVVAIGPRAVEDRPLLAWLAAVGVMVGVGTTVAIVHHHDVMQADAQVPSAQDVAKAVHAARLRFGR